MEGVVRGGGCSEGWRVEGVVRLLRDGGCRGKEGVVRGGGCSEGWRV